MLGEKTGSSQTRYLRGLDVIGQQNGGNWNYFLQDGLGSVRAATDPTGKPVYRASFDPFGNPLETLGSLSQTSMTGTDLGYTGEQTDPNSLVYLRARYYNPSLGNFTSRDPVGGVMGLSTSFNSYAYILGNDGCCLRHALNTGANISQYAIIPTLSEFSQVAVAAAD